MNATFDMLFPTTYGNTRFTSMEEVKEQKDHNPDAMGLFAQCSIFGVGTEKRGEAALDGLFEAANKGCTDAILMIARLYEYGMTFIRRDVSQALNLYKYAYSLENIDALHSLGYMLFRFYDKQVIGVSMMRKSAELGSRGARFQLQLLEDEITEIEELEFEDIPKKEFACDRQRAKKSLELYGVDLSSKAAIKSAMMKVMDDMKRETFSVIMNEFRYRYLRGRDMEYFSDIDFRKILESLVQDGAVEANDVKDYGVIEKTIYNSKTSTQKIKVTEMSGDEFD